MFGTHDLAKFSALFLAQIIFGAAPRLSESNLTNLAASTAVWLAQFLDIGRLAAPADRPFIPTCINTHPIHTNMHDNMFMHVLDRFDAPLQTWSGVPHSSSACLSMSTNAVAVPSAPITSAHIRPSVQIPSTSYNHMLDVKLRLILLEHATNVTIGTQSIKKTR